MPIRVRNFDYHPRVDTKNWAHEEERTFTFMDNGIDVAPPEDHPEYGTSYAYTVNWIDMPDHVKFESKDEFRTLWIRSRSSLAIALQNVLTTLNPFLRGRTLKIMRLIPENKRDYANYRFTIEEIA
jgi:hypothetical protein